METENGTYALFLRAPVERKIEVGALGFMTVDSGPYVYVGSAFGSGGLRTRVQRHVRGGGTRHWHIDYLRAVTILDAVWYTHDPIRRECAWAHMLRTHPGAWVPLEGFGASDCACSAHLVAFDDELSFSAFRERLRAEHFDHAPVERKSGRALSES